MSQREHATSSVMWNAGFVIFREVLLRFGVMVVLRRLIADTDYGQRELVNAIIGFLAMFSFNNFNSYIVQAREEKDVHLQDQFTAGGVIQIIMFGVANLAALMLRWFPQYAPVAPLVHVMSLVFLLEWPCEFYRRMLERSYDWKSLRVLHAIGLVLTQVAAVALAYAGAGVYALLVPGLLVTLPFTFVFLFRRRWRPTWEWSWENYRPAWKFGITRISSGLAFRGKQLLETAVVTARLGFGLMGVLGCALGLAQLFCQGIAEQLLNAIYPVLTRVNPDPANVARVNGLVLRIVAWMAVPMAVVLSALAAPVVSIYGPKWGEAVPLVKWAVLVGAGIALAQTVNTLLLSVNQIRRCLAADVLVLVGAVVVLVFALPHGVTAYLIGSAIVQALALALMLVWLVQKRGLNFAGIVNALMPPVVAAAAAFGFCHTLARLTGLDKDVFAIAVGYGCVFWLVYLAVLRIAFASQLRELMAYVPGRKYISPLLALKEV